MLVQHLRLRVLFRLHQIPQKMVKVIGLCQARMNWLGYCNLIFSLNWHFLHPFTIGHLQEVVPVDLVPVLEQWLRQLFAGL